MKWWLGLLLAGSLVSICPAQPGDLPNTVEWWAKERGLEALPTEVMKLKDKFPNFEKNFPLEWSKYRKELYLLWSVARACDFDLGRIQREYPTISNMASIVLAEKKEKGHSHLLTTARSLVNDGCVSLVLAHGDGEVPQLREFDDGFDDEKWKDTWLQWRSFSHFAVKQYKGQRYVVGQSYYHPFPNETTWPKYLLWVEIRGNQLVPSRAERYELPSTEKEIKPGYLKETISLAPD